MPWQAQGEIGRNRKKEWKMLKKEENVSTWNFHLNKKRKVSIARKIEKRQE